MGPRTATAGPPAKAGALFLCLTLTPCCSMAANTFTFGVEVGSGASDNIYEVESPKTSEIMPTVGLELALHREGTTLDADVTGLFSFNDYVHRSYANDVFGRFDGLLRAALVPERIVWVLQEDFGQAALNRFEPENPGNREYINFVSTGPDFTQRLGEQGFLRLGARYEDVHYQVSPLTSNRVAENLALGRELSAHSTVSLNVDAEQIRFEQTTQSATLVDGVLFPAISDFDRREAYLRYEARGARTTLSVNAGVSESDEGGTGWHSDGLLDLKLRRTLSPHTTLTLLAGQQLTDAAEGFRDLHAGAAGGIVIAPVAGTYGSYLARYGSGDWRFERERTTIALSERYEDDSYLTDPLLNAKRNDAELNVGRRLTPAVGVQLVGTVVQSNYYNQDFEAIEHRVGASLVVKSAREVEIRFLYDHLWRTATGVGTGFEENRVFLLLTYRPAGGEEQVNPTGLAPPAPVVPVPGRLHP